MKVYMVGGAVRDQLMGREPKDVDWVVVGSTPEEMIKLGFEQVGASFPVFLHPETRDEWALARMEKKTGDGYLGFSVATEGVTIESDLSRRDFSINSIAFDPDTGVYIDPFGGMRDLDNKILRHTSPAFSEDPLRVIRLARFYARYTEFSVADETMQLAKNIVDSGEMNCLSKERFVLEFEKVLNDSGSDFYRFIKLLFDLGVFQKVDFFKNVFGSIAPWHIIDMATNVETTRRNCPGAAGLSPTSGDLLVALLTVTVLNPDNAQVFGNDVKNALAALKTFESASISAEGIVDALFKTRSTRTVSTHAAAALRVKKAVRPFYEWKHFFSSDDWKKFASITANLDIIPLTEKYSGKELGEKIREAMIDAVQKELKNES